MTLSAFLVIFSLLTPGFLSIKEKNKLSHSEYEGITQLNGLVDSVTVYRDERGMPHIYASNEHDLYLVVGYVSAQERLWQMDLIRRTTAGRLSEIFGKSFRQVDIISRCLNMTEKSKIILQHEDPEIIACLEAYTEGINQYISSCKKLSCEFRILSYKPEPWCLEDIVNIIGLMGWSLGSRNLTAELFNYQLVRKTGAERASALIPDWDIDSEIVYPGFELDDSLISGLRSFILSFDKVKSLGVPSFSGSNNWAVSGDKSETGKPILSNDMHLPLNNPALWIQMHQVVHGKLNVTRVVIPGEPFVVAGHNEKIAWGMTNLMVDDVDLYTEKINPGNPDQYFFNGEWKELVKKAEIIKIRGGRQDTVTIRYTHRGPVISGLLNLDHVSQKVK
jgi:penicillin amidase